MTAMLLKGLRPVVELENLPEEPRSKHGCRVHDDLWIGCPALDREGNAEDAFLAPWASQQIAKNRHAPKEVVDAIERNIGSGKRKNLMVEVDPPPPRYAKFRSIERGIVYLKFGRPRRERHDHAVERHAFAG